MEKFYSAREQIVYGKNNEIVISVEINNLPGNSNINPRELFYKGVKEISNRMFPKNIEQAETKIGTSSYAKEMNRRIENGDIFLQCANKGNCASCGYVTDADNDNYCGKCGHKLKSVSSVK